MGLFHRKNKKKSIMLDDKYTIRLEFADQFKPENNTQVAEAIQSASETEKNNGLPDLDQTLPFATLKTAEDLFDNLRDVVAETADPIEFDYLAIWLFDKTKKAKMGKPNSDDGNPHEYITLPGFKLNYDYQNLTKVIFETIFNLPENSDVSYDEKIEICQDLKQAYLESVNVGENEIARLPKKAEIEKGAVTLDVPAYSTNEPPAEEPKKQYYDAKTHTFSDHPIEDDTLSTTETVAAESVSTPAPVPIEKPKPAAKPATPAAPVHETRSAVRAVTDAADDEQKLAREKGHVSAPQFEVAELDPVEPGQHGYVEYQLNQRKKTFNALLQNSAEKINDKNEKAILDLRESYKTKIEKAIANFRKQHKNDAANLHAKIANELYAAKERELKAEYAKIDRQREDDLEQAERVYHQQQSKINSDSENNKQQAEQRLSKHYEQLANKKFDTEWAEIKRRNDDAETKLRQEKQRHYELQAREDAAQLRVNGLDLLQQMLTDETQELDDYRTQVTNEHLNAKQIVISENRSETEKQRIQAPFEELREANKTISDLKEQLSRTEALRATAENENAALKSDKQLLQEKNDSLMNEKLAAAKELSTKDSENKNDELNSTLSNYIKFKLATEMQPQQSTTRVATVDSAAVAADDHQTSKGHGEQYTKQMDGMLHGVKRLVVMFFLLLVLMICGFSYYTYRQHKENAARVEQITQTMNKKVAKAKQTNSNVVQESYKASSTTDETQAALNALHASNGTELDKYKNEKYYALDKAIINSDAKAADAAVKAMGTDLAMNDRYRSTQAVSLLNQAGDADLANKVSDANK